jgi:hypothetical protein
MTCVECRLATARLVLGEIDGDSPALQHVDDCTSDLWVEGVNDAGDEELRRYGRSVHVDQR